MFFLPVHEVHEHFGVFLELPHLHCVWQNTVKVSEKLIHLEKKNTHKRKIWVRNTINKKTAVVCVSCSIPARAAECSASPCPPPRRPGWCGASASSTPPGSLMTCRPARPETWWPASSLSRSSGGDRRDRSERQRSAFRSVYGTAKTKIFWCKNSSLANLHSVWLWIFHRLETFLFFLLMHSLQAEEKNGKQSVAKQGILTY